MTQEEAMISWREYMDVRFARVYDSLEEIRKDIKDIAEKNAKMEERIESVNGRMWTVGAVSGAVGTGLGVIVAWLTGIGNWIRILK